MKKNSLFFLTLLIVPALILAQPAGKGKAESGRQPMKRTEMQCRGEYKTSMQDLLKLTDQQKTDHKNINLKYRRQNIQLRADLELANLDLREAIEKLEQKKIDESVKKINDIKARLYKNRIDRKVEFLKLLTEEQRNILREQPCRMRKVRRIQRPGGFGDMDLEAEIDFASIELDMPDDYEMDLDD